MDEGGEVTVRVCSAAFCAATVSGLDVNVCDFHALPLRQDPPRTVRVRIAVAVDAEGNWHTEGWPGTDDGEVAGYALEQLPSLALEGIVWLEADIPLPAEVVVKAEVVG